MSTTLSPSSPASATPVLSAISDPGQAEQPAEARAFSEEEQRLLREGGGSLDMSAAAPLTGVCPECDSVRYGLVASDWWLPGLPCTHCQAVATWEWTAPEAPGMGAMTVTMDLDGALVVATEEASFVVDPLDDASGLNDGPFTWADLADMTGLSALGVTGSKVKVVVACSPLPDHVKASPDARLWVEMLLTPRFLANTPAEPYDDAVDPEKFRLYALNEWGELDGYHGDDLTEIGYVDEVLRAYLTWKRPWMISRFEPSRISERTTHYSMGFNTGSAEGVIEHVQVECFIPTLGSYLMVPRERKHITNSRDAGGFAAAVAWMSGLADEYLSLEAKAARLGLLTVENDPQGRAFGCLE